MNLVLFKAVLGIYIAGTLGNLIYLASPREYLARTSLYIMVVGFALHLAWLVTRTYEAGHVPVTNMHESLSFFALAVIAVYLILAKKFGVKALGAFISPVAVIFMLLAASRPGEVGTLPPILRSTWLVFHPVFSFFGNALFALAFGAGAMYLIQEKEVKSKKLGRIFRRLPSLEVLDEMNFYCPFLTLGLISGSIWAQAAWEVSPYSSLEPKLLWAAVTWLIYASLFSGRLIAGWRGKKAAIFALVGFSAVMLGYLVVSLYLSGQHSFIK